MLHASVQTLGDSCAPFAPKLGSWMRERQPAAAQPCFGAPRASRHHVTSVCLQAGSPLPSLPYEEGPLTLRFGALRL